MIEKPIEMTFQSKIVDGGFATLDGKKELNFPRYSKYISSVYDLSSEEIDYILIRYSQMNQNLDKLYGLVAGLRN